MKTGYKLPNLLVEKKIKWTAKNPLVLNMGIN